MEIVRTLTKEEVEDIRPFYFRVQSLERQLQEAAALYGTVLRLMEPRFRNGELSFDPDQMAFVAEPETFGDGFAHDPPEE